MGIFWFLSEEYESSGGKNFRYLNDLIRRRRSVIVLDFDIVLADGEESEYGEGIEIDGRDIVIEGNFHSIDAGGKARILDIVASDVIIKNLHFKNANAFAGGAISSYDSNLKISNCKFSSNACEYRGGALYSAVNSQNHAARNGENVKLKISKCCFDENGSKDRDSSGGALCIRGSLAFIENSYFKDNSCGIGGAIDNDAILTVSECKFKGNEAFGFGGAICNDNAETGFSTLEIFDSAFEDNRSGKSGGAIALPCRNIVKVEDCSFEDNSPDDVN